MQDDLSYIKDFFKHENVVNMLKTLYDLLNTAKDDYEKIRQTGIRSIQAVYPILNPLSIKDIVDNLDLDHSGLCRVSKRFMAYLIITLTILVTGRDPITIDQNRYTLLYKIALMNLDYIRNINYYNNGSSNPTKFQQL